MKCDQCDNEATVHEVAISGGKRLERHFCQSCAAKAGIAVQAATPIAQLLSQVVAASTKKQPAPAGSEHAPESSPARGAPPGVCPSCGAAIAQLKQPGGTLGCEHCYVAFQQQLIALLERAHEGGHCHVGKTPRFTHAAPAAASTAVPPAAPLRTPDYALRAAALKKQLSDALAAEQYERAATIRDELSQLQATVSLALSTPRKPEEPTHG